MYFNPRAHEGRDAGLNWVKLDDTEISIHAPMRGATALRWSAFYLYGNFNPRAHEGRDFHYVRELIALTIFQSTRP